jgi:hypothetical protein
MQAAADTSTTEAIANWLRGLAVETTAAEVLAELRRKFPEATTGEIERAIVTVLMEARRDAGSC